LKTLNVTQARQNIYNLVDDTIEHHEPIQISSKKGNVILISENDFNSIQETLYLLSIPGMRETLIDGKNTPIDECLTSEEIGWDIE